MAADPRFKYQDISQIGITSAKIKEMGAYVMDTNGVKGYPLMVWTGLKILFLGVFVWLLDRVESREAQLKKQKYEGEQDDHNQEAIDNDDLGGERRA